MKKTIFYYSYGSNMSEQKMISRGLTPLNKQVAYLDNYKFIINKKSFKNPSMGFANIVQETNSVVEGILYEVLETDLKKMDKFEGFPKHYGREIHKLRLSDGSFVDGVVYVANPNWVSPIELKATNEYKMYILEGRQHISDTYYEFLNENIKI